MPSCRVPLAALLLISASVPALAAESAQCQLFRNQQWSSQGNRSLDDCLRLVDRQPAERGAGDADLKFGAWGEVMIAADRSNYYRSDNGGADWSPIGGKSGGGNASASSTAAAPAAAPVQRAATPRAAAAPAATAAPRASSYQPVPVYTPPAAPVTPITSTTSPYYPAGYNSATGSVTGPVVQVAPGYAAAPAATAATAAVAPQAFVATLSGEPYKVLQVDRSLDHYACELLVGQSWRRQRTTISLDQCATEMENKGARDRNGQLRAYWGTLSLTADSGVIYASRNGDDWIKLRNWGEPLPQLPAAEAPIKVVDQAPAKPSGPSFFSRMKRMVGLGKKDPPPAP